jgi:hypothetical protein
MHCTMTSPGLSGVRIFAAKAAGAQAAPCPPGRPCRQCRTAEDCLAARATGPVLDAFSAVVSYEPVLLAVDDGRRPKLIEETGQGAALRLLLAALGESGCPFFGELLPAGIGRPGDGDCRAAFQGAVRGRLDQPVETDPADTQAERARAIEAHLAPLLAQARRRRGLDAGLNAVIILINCVRLAVADAEDGPRRRHGPDAIRVVRRGGPQARPVNGAGRSPAAGDRS